MTRLQTHPVEVHRGQEDPDQFLWRGRLYVVGEVLTRWTQSGGWWSSAPLRALTAGDHAQERAAASVQACEQLSDGQRHWWRVEARCGRSGSTGVYDLSCDDARGTWALSRIQD